MRIGGKRRENRLAGAVLLLEENDHIVGFAAVLPRSREATNCSCADLFSLAERFDGVVTYQYCVAVSRMS